MVEVKSGKEKETTLQTLNGITIKLQQSITSQISLKTSINESLTSLKFYAMYLSQHMP